MRKIHFASISSRSLVKLHLLTLPYQDLQEVKGSHGLGIYCDFDKSDAPFPRRDQEVLQILRL